ncbi:MAG: hypothetical protein M1834_006844 [Cirrosporium novae-zelandiae]|nr:MAG: hypothetical protein M1834_006844 [Cirrosporium novae-zelandiae]
MYFLNDFKNLQLDIVGFLAILGEGSVESNAQIATLSKWIYLPRLIPAPQAFIRTKRPDRLETTKGKIVGAYSGNVRDFVNHIAHLLHDGDRFPAYSVRCMSIKKHEGRLPVKAHNFGPLAWLAVLGCLMSCTLIALSAYYDDGMALLATIFLSVLSSLVGVGSHWYVKLPRRTAKRAVPPGDVVIQYPQGNFLIVKCSENVARELYWAPEECIYDVGVLTYRMIALLSTLLLMCGVIFLANARLKLQLCFAAAYMILNAGYWIVAALPAQWHWDLSSFEIVPEEYVRGSDNETFTEALWMAIAITKSISWVKIGNITPQSPAWNAWLNQAEDRANLDPCKLSQISGMSDKWMLPRWDCQKALSDLLNPNSPQTMV